LAAFDRLWTYMTPNSGRRTNAHMTCRYLLWGNTSLYSST
jgi:hypothetical protein